MANKLFLRPLSAQNEPNEYLFDWALYDLNGKQLRHETTKGLSAIEQTLMQNGIEAVAVQVLWPASHALACQVSLPNTQARFVNQALPFAVEERLAQDLESVHIAHGKKGKGGTYPVVTVDKSAFSALNDALAESEILNLKSAVLDADSLLLDQADIVIALDADSALVKSADGKMLALAPENVIAYLDVYLAAQQAGADEPEDPAETSLKLRLYRPEEGAGNIDLLMAQLQQYPQLRLEILPLELSCFELCCESQLKQLNASVELCQGPYQVVSASNSQLTRWRPVVAVAACAFILQIAVFIAQGYYYQDQADKVGQQALASYQKLVPGSNRLTVSKLRRVIKGKLNQRSQGQVSSASFLDLLGEAGYQYQKSVSKGDFQFRSINFNEQRGELLIELRAKTFQQLNGFKDAIVSAGLTAKIGSSVQEQGYFRGRISVSGS